MPATSKGTLASALLAVQREAPAIQKDKVNPAFKGSRYASTDDILAAILPILNEHDLVLTQIPATITAGEEAFPALRSIITHVPTGDSIEETAMLMLDRSNAQGLGGAITYMRRYAVTSMLGLVTETDDDGNSASKVEVVNRRKSGTKKSRAKSTPQTDDGAGEDW